MLKPIQPSTSTFRDMIEGGFLYVDKTRDIYELVRWSKGIYFLSRPRRFGKSLLISTLDEIFQGNRKLFQGLWIDGSDYQWESYPIIRLDFNRIPIKSAAELKTELSRHLRKIASQYDITLEEGPYYAQFDDLIFTLSKKGKVVILVDEYDKPLIHNLDNLEEAKKIREVMKTFYGIIKGMDKYIRFVFITGISKFSKVSIFSELNHLEELTFDERFATMLGFTQEELDHYFDAYLSRLAQKKNLTIEQLKEKIRYWYDGFRFSRQEESVYNPFAIALLFKKLNFHNFWFESGTPTFLIQLIKEQEYDLLRFQKTRVPEATFSTYEIERLDIIPLLYQTGYLTIKEYDPSRRAYTLSYPNFEVKEAFLMWLMRAYSYTEGGISESYLLEMIDALKDGNLEEMFKILGVFFANIPYDLHVKQEKYYQTIFYLLFTLIGFRAHAEVQTNDGRIDAVVEFDDHIYLFEFKLDKSAEEAMNQIKSHQYYQKYQLHGKPITCIGANFNTKKRTVDDWKAEEIED